MSKLSSIARREHIDRLYIFVTSWQPDPYVNVLVYALQHYKLAQVYFVSIIEDDYDAESSEEEATEGDQEEANRSLSIIRSGVEDRLRKLADGLYFRRSASTEDPPLEISIGPAHANMYKKCLAMLERLETTSKTVSWAELDKSLEAFSGDGNGMFDVTALKNNLLVDVVVSLLSRGCTEIHAFEILKKGRRSYDERELIHNLKEGGNLVRGDYVYRNLLENANIKTAVNRIVSRSLTFRSLVLLTGAVGIIVLVIQIFFPKSWLETAVAVVATVAAIAGWLYPLKFN